jgi:hypothetical protein
MMLLKSMLFVIVYVLESTKTVLTHVKRIIGVGCSNTAVRTDYAVHHTVVQLLTSIGTLHTIAKRDKRFRFSFVFAAVFGLGKVNLVKASQIGRRLHGLTGQPASDIVLLI